MIHTYSGLFVVVVNPYKRYPIYTHRWIYILVKLTKTAECIIKF
jgi:myosin heavy subunit